MRSLRGAELMAGRKSTLLAYSSSSVLVSYPPVEGYNNGTKNKMFVLVTSWIFGSTLVRHYDMVTNDKVW